MTRAEHPLPGLKRELLSNLAAILAAALSLAVLTTLLVQAMPPRLAMITLVTLIVADILVLYLFGRHLLQKLVLEPLESLTAAADAVADGNLSHVAPPADTAEFSRLADRFNHMTERLGDMQAQLVRAEKLASVGRLAAGIAHEVGNPLGAIGTYVEVLDRRGADPEVVRAVRREAARIDQIVRGLLDYAGRREERLGRVDVGAVVRSVIDLLTHQGTLRGLNVSVEIGERLPRVRARTHSLEQVVVNLILNAVDAAPGGTVAVGAAPWRYRVRAAGERRSTDPEGIATPRPHPPGRRAWRPELVDGAAGVQLWVADSGPGIATEDRDAIFDPFYTTKEPGKGTGLGLAIVNRTVHELGGVVWIDDAREGGAAFKIFLPDAGEDDSGHGARSTERGGRSGADPAPRAPRSEPSADPAPRAPRPAPPLPQ